MNRNDLVNTIAADTGMTKKDVDTVINHFLNSVKDAMAAGKKVQLVGFGTFEVKERAEHTGRNPATGESVVIPATKVPTFKAGKALKEMTKGESAED